MFQKHKMVNEPPASLQEAITTQQALIYSTNPLPVDL